MTVMDPHMTHDSLGPPESATPNGISIGSAVFCVQRSKIDCQCFRRDRTTSNIVPSPWKIWTPI